MEAEYNASQSAIGLIDHFDRIPNDNEAEQWLRELGGLKHARAKAIKGRCRTALGLLQPINSDFSSLRQDYKYRYFPTRVLKRIEEVHRPLLDYRHRDIQAVDKRIHDWTHPVPFIGLRMTDYEIIRELVHKTHPGKPDYGVQPGALIHSEGQHLYANMYKLENYQTPDLPRMTIQELSTKIYATTTATQECNLQYAKSASLFARQLVTHSSKIKQAVPIFIQPDEDDIADVPFNVIVITFENGSTTILPLAIQLAAVPVHTIAKRRTYTLKPLISWSTSIMNTLKTHD